MSSITWTPTAVASNGFEHESEVWRAVEAQHQVSTMKLVDTLDEQKLLEELLDQSKPPAPKQGERLHYLLFTPFRYRPTRSGSRFRAATDPGVYYAATEIRTACAELGYWRWRFLKDSPGLGTLGPLEQTLFAAAIHTRCLDLRKPPLDQDHAHWTHPGDYTATQEIARVARQAEMGGIWYESVRDPQRGGCLAVLTPDAFRDGQIAAQQTWWLTVMPDRSIWQRSDLVERATHEFAFG